MEVKNICVPYGLAKSVNVELTYYRSCCEARVTGRAWCGECWATNPSQTPECGFSQVEHGMPTAQRVIISSRVTQCQTRKVELVLSMRNKCYVADTRYKVQGCV